MLHDFFVWWIAQIRDLIPERLRRFGSPGGDALIITLTEPLAATIEAAEISLRRNGQETDLGRFGLAQRDLANLPRAAGKATVLRLAEADVLAKTVTLPLSAERQLDQVLSFEMDRETPFSTEEVFWTHRIARRDRQREQMSVRLLLLPKAALAAPLAALGRAGFVPTRAEIAAGRDRGCYLPLDEHGGLHGRADRSVLRWPAVACCIGLAVATIVTPFARQSFALDELEAKVAAGRKAVAAADKLRDEIAGLTETLNLIESERDKAGRPLETLAAATGVLPDDTYLTELRQQQHKITLSGSSAGASRLIGMLAASNQLRNPVFAAPVRRVEGAKSEIFTITSEVGPWPPR